MRARKHQSCGIFSIILDFIQNFKPKPKQYARAQSFYLNRLKSLCEES